MRYFLQTVETESGLPFEREVGGVEEYETLRSKLEGQGYSDFYLDEMWSSLDEMYSNLETEAEAIS